jgi:putative transposase
MDIGHINNVTVEKTPTGKYYVILNVDFEPEFYRNNGCEIGIDVGIKEFCSDSNGNIIKNPKYFEKSLRKLCREQKRLSRKQKGSNNRNKQRIKVARIHERITNQRNDFLQKQSTILVRENQTICIEDLNVSGMMKNRHLSKAVAQQKFFEFKTKLMIKCKEYGIELRVADRFFPSSRTCHDCGCVKTDLKLSDRIYHCDECGYTEDRDYNASLNLRDCLTYNIA